MAQTLFEGGQKKPIFSAGTLAKPEPGFITIEDLIAALLGAQGGPDNSNLRAPQPLLSATPVQNTPIPLPNPMQSQAPPDLAGSDDMWKGITELFGKGGSLLEGAGAAVPLDMFGQALQSMQNMAGGFQGTEPGPGVNLQTPFPRGPENSAAGNIAAGFGNSVANLPGNMWELYQQFFGRPSTDFFLKPEGAGKEEPAAPPPSSFTPGMPKPAGGGTTSRIQTAENSTGNPAARNPKSSAMGNGQFLRGTWLDFMREVHPDELDAIGEAGALKLRADPKWADEATSWYAGKAVDVLDSMNMPATDTNIYLHHFLGPKGVKQLLAADPNAKASDVLDGASVKANMSILGNGRTVEDVINWAAGRMGEMASIPPTSRAPVVMPDFSKANEFFNSAAPRPIDPQLQKEAMFAQMLAGIGGGLQGSPQTGGELFGNLAAGAGAGLAGGKTLQLELQREFQQQQSAYSMARGEIAQGQESILTAGRNAQQDTDFLNAEDQRNWLTQQDATARAANTTQIIEANADGIFYKTPDGNIQHLSTKVNDPFKQLETVAGALGGDSATARQLKYNLMSQTPGTNLLSFQMEIARDIIQDGLGPSIFGDAYTEALAVAEEQMPPALQAKPELYQQELQNIITGLLLGSVQQSGDTNWILQAAQMGNAGALLLTQNGSFEE